MSENQGARLRQLIEARNGLLVPGVMNALAARIAEDIGFKALYLTGAGVTNAHLGLPDIGLITASQMTETLAHVRNITDLPLIVDGDTGFGNAVNVWHTLRAFERAGANAIQLEDQVFPKKCGHFTGKNVVPIDDMVQKVKAAVDTRRSDDFLVIARTDAYAVHGLQDALERAERFIEAGADVTFVEAPKKAEDIRTIVGRLPVPQVVNMVIGGQTPDTALQTLQEIGVGMVLYANASLQGAIKGMQDALTALKETGSISEADGLVASFSERQRLVGKPELDALEKRYSDRS